MTPTTAARSRKPRTLDVAPLTPEQVEAQARREVLHPGRVFTYTHDEGFTVMFGEFLPPTLRIAPRSYSLGSDATLDTCEALGRSLIEAAAFGRTLLALTA